jgi:hypothetical protein
MACYVHHKAGQEASDFANPFGLTSMERSVKTDLSRSPTVLFNGGVRFQSARAAGLARVQLAGAETLAPCAVLFASAMASDVADPCGGLSLPPC